MVWLSPAQGNRPYAPPTGQAVYKLVTPSPKNAVFYPFSFQSLEHSLVREHSPTPLQSYCSALFRQNRGSGYIPQNRPVVFKSLHTLPKPACPTCPAPACRSMLACGGRSSRRRSVGGPLYSNGKRSLSLFSLYRYQTLSCTTSGVHPPQPACQVGAGLSREKSRAVRPAKLLHFRNIKWESL